jgi:hypothetical protein
MKKITMIFTALAFVIGVAVISCTKQSTAPDPAITTATDVVLVDNAANDISGTIDSYEAVNPTQFVDPASFKALSANGPVTLAGMGVDKCATVTIVRTPTLTANVVTGATLSFKIDFGTAGCVGKDGKARRGTITSTYTWVKEAAGWSRVSAIDLYVSDVHHVGTQTMVYSLFGPNKHAYFTETSTLTVTQKDGTTWSKLVSNRTRELLEGNGGVNPVKTWKINGSSTFSNSAGETATHTISTTDPLIKRSDCKTFTSGTVTTVDKANVTTTVTYSVVAPATCPDGFTITVPAKNGKSAFQTFIKFGN